MSARNSEDVIGAARPFTGKEYLESLRDGREIYIYGERVDGRDHPPGVSQLSAHHRQSLRRAARSQA